MSIPGSATLADITSTDWSLMLDSTAAKLGLQSGLGNVVQGLADVDQCIAIILTTLVVCAFAICGVMDCEPSELKSMTKKLSGCSKKKKRKSCE